jgi:DNA-binding Lrp family transcriptional regulator
VLDETDLMVIDALQINPRATWAQIGGALEVAPITVARRWERLSQAGQAWVNVGLGLDAVSSIVLAIIELSCQPGQAAAIGEKLADVPQVVTIEHTTGEFDTVLIVTMPSLASLSDFLLIQLSQHPGIIRVRSHVCTKLFGGTSWRLGVLSPSQAGRLEPDHQERPEQAAREARPFGPDDRRLFRALGVDGRASATSLGRALGVSAYAVNRRLNLLRDTGQLVFRCDLARPLAGWHGLVLVRIEVPDAELASAGRTIAAWRETRLCAAVASSPNLFVLLGLHSTDDVGAHMSRINERLPGSTIVERCLVLRQTKVYGRLLGDDGRALATVPVDPWADDAVAS